mgnify:CR=1 FL=1
MAGDFQVSLHPANANSQGKVFKMNMPLSLLWWIAQMLKNDAPYTLTGNFKKFFVIVDYVISKLTFKTQRKMITK